MSIAVKEISKRYGSQLAVNKVSFEVHTGEIVGFIGPNGAGKSTTMKMITGTLSPDSGSIRINDLSALEHQREIRGMIGYLPENNPLYHEMYIREYLQYVAGLYKLNGKEARERISIVIEMTSLSREVSKKIGNLSKGYRQRVGLAQALLHDPEILILDEPTSGLDPNQLVEIRNLVSNIGKEKTVLLSTHILQEVEAICDRVIIINNGGIVADDDAQRLKEKGAGLTQTIHIELDEVTKPEIWKKLLFIDHVKSIGNNQFLLETRELRDIRGDIFNFAVSQGLTILSLSLKKKSLEEVFRELTSQ
ncbi:MAG: gliding motility-associated ABC transporter ATP-binding subunit GldA [Bacteroidetes bacterium]|nr:MAG: gliding motility-associated ABC transporter ATP-binding subunit GldA [Bacteroidota bacterium]RLD96294.1 MAG: gliding motility-associated ABC transporter ATP-binding subunit GldA [Bacteroidota bacterium]